MIPQHRQAIRIWRVAYPSFFEGWDSTDASIMGFRVPLHNPLDARISHWGRPFPTFVAGATHLKLQESNAVGLRQDPSQNPRWLKIGNAHPWRKTAKDGPRTARRRER